MTLRVRLALAFALLAGLVAAAVGVVVYELTQQDLLDRARAKAFSWRWDQYSECPKSISPRCPVSCEGSLSTDSLVVYDTG